MSLDLFINRFDERVSEIRICSSKNSKDTPTRCCFCNYYIYTSQQHLIAVRNSYKRNSASLYQPTRDAITHFYNCNENGDFKALPGQVCTGKRNKMNYSLNMVI